MLMSLQELERLGLSLQVLQTVKFPDSCNFRSLLQSKPQLLATTTQVRNRHRDRLSNDSV